MHLTVAPAFAPFQSLMVAKGEPNVELTTAALLPLVTLVEEAPRGTPAWILRATEARLVVAEGAANMALYGLALSEARAAALLLTAIYSEE